jgi:SpoVK/Ycf46/Vps4 family AAA+-type ATPase
MGQVTKPTFDSIVITQKKREEIKAAISQINNLDLIFETWGFKEVFEKGTAITLLFYGLPGCGKSLAAEAIAEHLGADLKIYGMAEIGSSEPGGSERIIQDIFAKARNFFFANKKHQVVLFDECDALLYDRSRVGVIIGAQINTLLTEIEKHDGIIIFTTNRLGVLDPALERRIAAKIEFPFPISAERELIWKRMIPKIAPIAKDVDFHALAGHPMAGGNIKNAVLNAARMAAYKKQKEITMQDFTDAIEKEAMGQKAFEAEADAETRGRLFGHTHKDERPAKMSDNHEIEIPNIANFEEDK